MKTKKIVALAGSTSSQSINKQLLSYALQQLDHVDVKVLDLNAFEMPIYSFDREVEGGIPTQATEFISQLHEADAFVISVAEHNAGLTVAFKNILDWASRANMNIFNGKPIFLLGSSVGRYGAAEAMDMCVRLFPRLNGEIVTQFSLPSFNDTFENNTIVDEEKRVELAKQVKAFAEVLVEEKVEA